MGYLIASALDGLIEIINFVLIIRIILSFVINNSPNDVVYKIYNITVMITEPALAPVRNLIWRVFPSSRNLPIDFSPIAFFLIIDFIIRPIIYMIF